MEHRLCYQRATPESPGSTPVLERAQQLSESRRMLHALDAQKTYEISRDALASIRQPEALRAAVHRDFAHGIPDRLNMIQATYAPLLTGKGSISDTLLPALAIHNVIHHEVEAMITAIAMPVPANAGRDHFKHRYVNVERGRNGKEDWYGIDFAAINTDRKALAQYATLFPEQRAALALLDEALAQYERQDPRMAVYQLQEMKGKSKVDGAVKEVGRLGIIIVAGTMAIITGIMAFRGKGGYLAPLLYAGIAGFLASPDLRRSIFGSKNEQALNQLNLTVNSKGFRDASIAYNIAGPAWETYASSVMDQPSVTRTFMREIRKRGLDPAERESNIDAYIRAASTDPTVRATLRKMIEKHDFDKFAGSLFYAKNPDTQETVSRYIATGSMRFEQEAREAAATYSPRPIPQEYPRAGILGMSPPILPFS